LIYIVGVAAPSIIQLSLGQTLATLSAFLSEKVVGLSGMPVAWQGTQFSIASETGDYIAATVTPGLLKRDFNNDLSRSPGTDAS